MLAQLTYIYLVNITEIELLCDIDTLVYMWYKSFS